MSIGFPISPIDKQTFTTNMGTAYIYDGVRQVWLINAMAGSHGLTGYQGITVQAGDDWARNLYINLTRNRCIKLDEHAGVRSCKCNTYKWFGNIIRQERSIVT